MYIVEIVIKRIDDSLSEEEIGDTGIQSTVAEFDDSPDGLNLAKRLAARMCEHGRKITL